MEQSEEKRENRCGCAGTSPVKDYCGRCKMYICADCRVARHMDHECDIVDLAEKCTRYLAQYQKLARTVSLLADRRQMHIKDESLDCILTGIKAQLAEAQTSLVADIHNTTMKSLEYLGRCPLLEDLRRQRERLALLADGGLESLREELSSTCKRLLGALFEEKYETADRTVDPERLLNLHELLEQLQAASGTEDNFVAELRNLRETRVQYVYNPAAVLGIIHLDTEVHRPPRLTLFDRDKNLLYLYRLDTRQLTTVPITCGFVLPYRFMTVEVQGRIYLSGGDNDHDGYLSTFYLYDELCSLLVPRQSMHEGRTAHALLGVESTGNIWAIGGEGKGGVLRTCETYEIKTNQWRLAPSLNVPRRGHAACMLGLTIYTIGGWSGQTVSTMERLLPDAAVWTVVSIKKKPEILALQQPGVVALNEHELFVFGGYKCGNDCVRESAIFDARKAELRPTRPLTNGDGFIGSEVVRVGHHVYAFGYEKGGVHEYDVLHNQWTYTRTIT